MVIDREARQALDYGDANPRKCPIIRFQLSGEEYDALVGAADAFGVDVESMDTLMEKCQISHNAGLDQFVRLIVQGAVDGTSLDAEPSEGPRIPAAGTRIAELHTGLTPAEKDVIESAEADTDGSLNHGTARKARSIVQNFLDEVYK